MTPRRVVVTGLGLVTPLGVGTVATWTGLLEGRVATGPVRSFDAARYRVDRGAEIEDFRPGEHLRRLRPAAAGRASQLAAVAASLALADAGLEDESAADARVPRPERCGVAMGTTSGEPAEIERFDDAWVAGAAGDAEFVLRYPCHVIAQNVAREVGDFVLRRADGLFAYQLAVVVDDADQHITHVVRGEDLADNTPRQLLLQAALGLPAPRYLHTPLVRGADGEKLSKQHGAPALETSDPLKALQRAAEMLGLSPVPAQTQVTDALAHWVMAWRALYNPAP